MRTDILQDKKCIHVKLNKDVHVALRSRLFRNNLSMQEVFNEFAKSIVSDETYATKIIENIVMRKVRALIEGRPLRQKSDLDQRISELDHDVLYDLIEEGTTDPDEAA